MNDKHIARTLGKDKITAIDAIISKKYIDRDGLYKDLSGMADEMYLHSISESRSTLSERSIKISKSNTDREVYEQYSPYCLKSHLRCWPFGKQDHLTIDFKTILATGLITESICLILGFQEILFKYEQGTYPIKTFG